MFRLRIAETDDEGEVEELHCHCCRHSRGGDHATNKKDLRLTARWIVETPSFKTFSAMLVAAPVVLLAALFSTASAQTFRRTAACPKLGCVFPPDQVDFIAGRECGRDRRRAMIDR